MIIWLAEKMHPSCSNKLLKLIEEPPNKTLFLLITEDEEAVIINHPFTHPTDKGSFYRQ
jgi:DNA polymerase III subunit delta'